MLNNRNDFIVKHIKFMLEKKIVSRSTAANSKMPIWGRGVLPHNSPFKN
jgi:hypothetical protein